MAERFAIQQISSLRAGGKSQLRAIANKAIDLVMQAQEQVAQNIIISAVDNYSTAEPGETYERTGRLAEGWAYLPPRQMPDGSIRTVIYNTAVDDLGRAYSGLVQGELQTIRHENAHWHTIDTISKEHSTEQGNRVRAAIRRAGEL